MTYDGYNPFMKRFDFIGGALCLDFINTVHRFGAANPGEELRSLDDLLDWAAQAGVLGTREFARLQGARARNDRLGRSLLAEAKEIRSRLRLLFVKFAHKRSIGPTDAYPLNLVLKKFPARPWIRKSSDGWQLIWRPESSGAQTIFYEVLRSAAELMASDRLDRVRECFSPSCTWMFLDVSKNHTRRWCDMRVCGNRAKVYRFRERRRRGSARRATGLRQG
jgi:predicted RNA-binding Zn ribbon-like protein